MNATRQQPGLSSQGPGARRWIAAAGKTHREWYGGNIGVNFSTSESPKLVRTGKKIVCGGAWRVPSRGQGSRRSTIHDKSLGLAATVGGVFAGDR